MLFSVAVNVVVVLAMMTGNSVSAQIDLPGGVDETKPGDPNALDSVLACGQASNDLLVQPAVYQSLVTLRQAAVVKMATDENLCASKGNGDAICTMDYGTIPTDFKSVCESNGGIYDENDHQVTCEAPNDPSITGKVIYAFTNYPTCFSNTCSDTDLERWIADEVDDFELDVERDTAWICNSDYTIDESTEAPKNGGAGDGGICPNRVNDTPTPKMDGAKARGRYPTIAKRVS